MELNKIEINKETQFLTTNLRVAQYLKWLGFWMEKGISTNGRELFIFNKSKELQEAFIYFKQMRYKLREKARLENKDKL